MAAIRLENVGLEFRLRQPGLDSLKDVVLATLRGRRRPAPAVKPLESFSLELRNGDRIGIIGRNGSGKSTLLRVLAGVYPPTSGICRVEGRVSALFDFTSGFEGQATGRQNIFYRGYLQGETPGSLRGKVDEIIEFSELGEFIDVPVRCYSSGMIVRLGFSIATATNPEILLIDECLGAGDAGFHAKAARRMDALLDRARILVLVSHDLNTVRRCCNRVIWMDGGRIIEDGRPERVIAAYEAAATAASAPGVRRIAG